MCRYDGRYACRWACFNCRKAFKGHAVGQLGHVHGDELKCPECGQIMTDMGQDFKPPRRDAKNQWKKLVLLVNKGVTFHSCGCTGPGPRPRTLSEAKRPGPVERGRRAW